MKNDFATSPDAVPLKNDTSAANSSKQHDSLKFASFFRGRRWSDITDDESSLGLNKSTSKDGTNAKTSTGSSRWKLSSLFRRENDQSKPSLTQPVAPTETATQFPEGFRSLMHLVSSGSNAPSATTKEFATTTSVSSCDLVAEYIQDFSSSAPIVESKLPKKIDPLDLIRKGWPILKSAQEYSARSLAQSFQRLEPSFGGFDNSYDIDLFARGFTALGCGDRASRNWRADAPLDERFAVIDSPFQFSLPQRRFRNDEPITETSHSSLLADRPLGHLRYTGADDPSVARRLSRPGLSKIHFGHLPASPGNVQPLGNHSFHCDYPASQFWPTAVPVSFDGLPACTLGFSPCSAATAHVQQLVGVDKRPQRGGAFRSPQYPVPFYLLPPPQRRFGYPPPRRRYRPQQLRPWDEPQYWQPNFYQFPANELVRYRKQPADVRETLPVAKAVESYRTRQILIGKNSADYQYYSSQRAKESRAWSDPVTPRIDAPVDCGTFARQMIQWKRAVRAKVQEMKQKELATKEDDQPHCEDAGKDATNSAEKATDENKAEMLNTLKC